MMEWLYSWPLFELIRESFSRYVNVGLFYLRQLFFAWFDYQVHTSKGKLIANVFLKVGMDDLSRQAGCDGPVE